MPFKDLEQSKKYHHKYYKIHKNSQLRTIRQERKETPWKYTLVKIKTRCNNKNSSDYKYYGGRGIKCLITEEELKTLWFRDKAYNMKKPSIDRIDNDGNYEYNNCEYIELSDNIIKKNLIKSKKKIIQYTVDGKFIKKWNSITEASEHYNCHISNISNNLINKNKTACGFIWRYNNEV